MATDEFDLELSELENRLERLRALYEQYFVGIEKIEPAVARKDVDRRFWELRKVKVRNTAKRFKLQTLIQRYNTLQQYWMKVCRQIENGTYVRHLARAKRRLADVNGPELPQPPALLEESLSADDPSPEEVRAAFRDLARSSERPRAGGASSPPLRLPRGRNPNANEPTIAAIPSPTLTSMNDKSGVVPPPLRKRAAPANPAQVARERSHSETSEVTRVATPSRQPPASTPRATHARPASSPRHAPPARPHAAAASAASALSDARIERLHAELERAQQGTGSDPISRAALAKSLRQTEAKLQAKHAGKQVDFRVEVKDGKPIIKPVVKR